MTQELADRFVIFGFNTFKSRPEFRYRIRWCRYVERSTSRDTTRCVIRFEDEPANEHKLLTTVVLDEDVYNPSAYKEWLKDKPGPPQDEPDPYTEIPVEKRPIPAAELRRMCQANAHLRGVCLDISLFE